MLRPVVCVESIRRSAEGRLFKGARLDEELLARSPTQRIRYLEVFPAPRGLKHMLQCIYSFAPVQATTNPKGLFTIPTGDRLRIFHTCGSYSLSLDRRHVLLSVSIRSLSHLGTSSEVISLYCRAINNPMLPRVVRRERPDRTTVYHANSNAFSIPLPPSPNPQPLKAHEHFECRRRLLRFVLFQSRAPRVLS